LRSRGQNDCQAQANQYDRSLKFFHAFCRSPHSGQSLILFPRVAVLRMEGHIWSGLCPLTILRHIANLQAPYTLRQGIPPCSANPPDAPACPSLLIFTLKITRSIWTTLAPSRGICSQWRCFLSPRGTAASWFELS